MPSPKTLLSFKGLKRPDFYSSVLLLTGLSLWIWSAIDPFDFETWLIEQVATLIGIAVLVFVAFNVNLSRASYLALLALFCIHTIGTHYTYSLTPYEQLSVQLFGSSPNEWFGWERNHYDRFVHFSYGLLTAYPIEQTLQQRLSLTPTATKFIGLNMILSTSAVYELAEWSAAITIGGNVGAAYLGTQGDIWDAQADIALAGAGWLLFSLGCAIHWMSKRTTGFPLT